jgi:carotenoid cleavage dioxygenase
MAQFPDTPSFTGFNTPSRIKADITDLAHEGTIPAGLNGAFYRVQPDPQFPPGMGHDIAFNGDGMITRFHIHDGQADFRQRREKPINGSRSTRPESCGPRRKTTRYYRRILNDRLPM